MKYRELNPLIRGRELEFLSNEAFERTIRINSVEMLGEVLKSTIYSPYIYGGYEYDFGQNLLKEQSRLFRWLKESVPEPETVWIYTVRYTFHNLKALTKARMTNQNLDHLYIDDGFYSLETLKDAIHTQVSNEFPGSIMDSIREVRDYFEEFTVLQGISVIYDRQSMTEQRRLAGRLGYQELLTEVITFIDLTNITMMARGILQGRTCGFMTAVLSGSGSTEKEVFLNFVDKDMEAYTNFLLETGYAEFLRPIIREGDLDLVKLEQLKDDYLSSLYQEAQTQAFGPLPLLAFLNAKEVESKDLCLLVISKRGYFEPEIIRKRVRQVYDTQDWCSQ